MSQSIDYRFLDGEPIELSFGEDRKPFYVQEGLLKKIPYFEKAIHFAESAQAQNSSSSKLRVIDLHDCNAKAVADVIHFTIIDHVPSISDSAVDDTETTNEPDSDNEYKDGDMDCRFYVQAWIVADRFGLEKIANSLIDEIVKFGKRFLFNPQLVAILAQADHGKSLLCGHLIRDIGCQIAMKSYKKARHASYAGGEEERIRFRYKKFKVICQEMPSELLALIINASMIVQDCPTKDALKNPCLLHKHESTDQCPLEESENESSSEDEDEDEFESESED